MSLPILSAEPVFIVLFQWTALLTLAWITHWAMRRGHARWRLILWRTILCSALLLPALQCLPLREYETPIRVDIAPATEAALQPATVYITSATATLPPVSAALSRTGILPQPILWGFIIAVVWMLGSACGFARLVRLHLQLFRLRKQSRPADAGIQNLVAAIQNRMHIRRELDVGISDAVTSPFVCGFLHPVIILPRGLTEVLPPAEMEALLSHEIAHLLRNDLPWCVLWRWMLALCWWHPLVWGIPAAHSLACDQQADRLASVQLADPGAYTRMLARLALRILALPALETTLAMNASSQIARRLILLGKKGTANWKWRHSVEAFALAASLFLVAARYFPTQDYVYPSAPGVYVRNGNQWILISGTRYISLRHVVDPNDFSILISSDKVADAKYDISGFGIRDVKEYGENPKSHLPAILKRVGNHPDMVMIVPTQSLEPGMYGVQCGRVFDVRFGVGMPDNVAYWKSLVQKHPEIVRYHSELAFELSMRNDLAGAAEQYGKVVELRPKSPWYHISFAEALMKEGRFVDAVTQYESTLDIEKTYPAKARSEIYMHLGDAYLGAQRYDDAIKTYRHGLDLDPDNWFMHHGLGDAFLAQGKIDDAIAEYSEAVKMNPPWTQGHLALEKALRMKAGVQ